MAVERSSRPRSILLTAGFRPFFLLGALHAAAVLALWVPAYLGAAMTPGALPPVAWHSHELLFGYVPAIVAGFLLTAVANWTGRAPVSGALLGVLVALWLLGRLAVTASGLLAVPLVVLASIAFPLALLAVIGREIITARDWRNLKVLAGLVALVAAQGLFHLEVWRDGRTTYADHLAVAATVTLIIIIGGRIVPAFTANWLKRNKPGPAPAPFGAMDRLAVALAVAALAAWVALPGLPGLAPAAGPLLLAAGVAGFARQARWQPQRTLAEPMVTVLHVGYAFVPVGFLLAGAAAMAGDHTATGATHAWTVGAVGLMTLAVMTRATRGHTGHPLTAPAATVAIYAGIIVAVAARITAAYSPSSAPLALGIAAVGWVSAFLGFALAYGRMLLGTNPGRG
jgi:uncharacterized protein involved in response to NO